MIEKQNQSKQATKSKDEKEPALGDISARLYGAPKAERGKSIYDLFGIRSEPTANEQSSTD